MKKLLSILLTVMLLLSVCPLGLFSITASAATSGTTRDCTWKLDGTVLTISGKGGMANYSYNYTAPWGTSITKVIINDGVTSIGMYAFYCCTGLTSITIPNSVTSIGRYAFYYCTGLTSITLPFIGGSATENNYFGYIFGASSYSDNSKYVPSSLKSVILTEKCTNISDYEFYGCSGLTSITIPDSVTSIGSSAFSGCSNLKYNIYDKGKYLGNEKNNYLALIDTTSTYIKSFKFADGVKLIGDGAFYYCRDLTSITIPNSVTGIGGSAFNGCYDLTSITIPNSVTSIGDGAFSNCSSLTSITIPDSVTSIGYDTFYGCRGLTSITIPDSVIYIGGSAFSGCSGLTSITIPNSVTSIGSSAFYGCSGLTDVWYTGESKSNISISGGNSCLENAHWHFNTCDGEHTYSSDCDRACNICEYVRSTTIDHNWNTNNSYDNNTHWVECLLCGEKKSQPAEHSFTVNNGQTCEACKYSKAPSKPTLSEKRNTTVTLTGFANYEYSRDGVNWQTSNVFDNLSPDTEYTFYQRIAETDVNHVSEPSVGLTVKTDIAMNSTEFKDGNGTDYAPYLVSTKEHLNNVRKYPNAYFKQVNDIVFTNADFASGGTYYNNGYGWMPIGKDSSSAFSGNYDGGGYSIKNITVNITTVNSAYGGLFGYCSGNLKNITVENGNITLKGEGTVYAGGIVGYHASGTVENCHNKNTAIDARNGGGIIGYSHYSKLIKNRSNSGKINGVYIGGIVGTIYAKTTNYGSDIILIECVNNGELVLKYSSGAYIGGIAGYVKSGTLGIEKCINNGRIYAEGSNFGSISFGGAPVVGGIVGYSYGTYISDCSNSADIYGHYSGGIVGYGNTKIVNSANTGDISGAKYVGGIVGQHNSGSIASCINKGNILGVRYENGKIAAAYSDVAGGIIGAVDKSSGIFECANLGTVKNGKYSGGIAGIGNSVTRCYNTGNITSTEYSGGICGNFLDSSGKISNCYNTGNVNGKYAAGLLANMKYGEVNKSYNIGKIGAINSGGYIGGIVAYQSSGIITDCYYSDNINIGVGYVDYSVSNTPEAIRLSEKNMQDSSNYEDFDFDTVWTMDGNEDYLYPELRKVEMIYVPYIPGDLDGVEGITDADAIYLLMHTYFPEDYPLEQPCDFNGDGAVTDADAVYLLMYTYFPEDYPIK